MKSLMNLIVLTLLLWNLNTESDMNYYKVYCFNNLLVGWKWVAFTDRYTFWLNMDGRPSGFYCLTAVDRACNESNKSISVWYTAGKGADDNGKNNY